MAPIFESIIIGLLTYVTPSPSTSLKIAAVTTGADYQELRHICIRESTCRSRVRVHVKDSWAAPNMYKKAIKAGWLAPNCPRKGQQVRGILGLATPYNTKWSGLKCLWPPLFDVPIVSAFIGAVKHNEKCWHRVEVVPGQKIREINPRGANGWCR